MKIVIAGATGMVGSIILRRCLEDSSVEKVISFVRKSSGNTHPKLEEVIQRDFKDYSDSTAHFEKVHAAFFCIGVYTGAVEDALFKEITVDYSNAFADAVASSSPSANFCLLSGQGADQTEKSSVSFARYKGMAENFLQSKNFKGLYLFRPGYIYPVEKRKEPNLSYQIFRKLYPVFKLMGKKYSITSEELALAMFNIGINGITKSVLENADILETLNS